MLHATRPCEGGRQGGQGAEVPQAGGVVAVGCGDSEGVTTS